MGNKSKPPPPLPIPEPNREDISDAPRAEIEDFLRTQASQLKNELPKGYGFALLIFDFGPDGFMSWMSNAEREDMVRAMKEFIALAEGRRMPMPKGLQ